MSIVYLPLPKVKGVLSLEETLLLRRSIREYKKKSLTLEQLSQLLWATQGISYPRWKFRTAPSAGATYPLEVYVVVGEEGVENVDPGIYHYNPHAHIIKLIKRGDYRQSLYNACWGQIWVREAPVNIVITAIYERTTRRYGERGIRYVHFEVGHACQNLYLQATALGLGVVAIGAFSDSEIRRILDLDEDEYPQYVVPVGVPSRTIEAKPEELIEYIKRYRELMG